MITTCISTWSASWWVFVLSVFYFWKCGFGFCLLFLTNLVCKWSKIYKWNKPKAICYILILFHDNKPNWSKGLRPTLLSSIFKNRGRPHVGMVSSTHTHNIDGDRQYPVPGPVLPMTGSRSICSHCGQTYYTRHHYSGLVMTRATLSLHDIGCFSFFWMFLQNRTVHPGKKCFFFLGLMMRNFLLDTDWTQDWTEELWLSSDAGWLIFNFVAHV